MQGLFCKVVEKKPKQSLMDMARDKFGNDTNLLGEISKYLASRRQARNYPTKTAWACQLDLLMKLPVVERAKSVHRSTLCGYRSIAYENNTTTGVTRNKVDTSTQISNRGF